MKLSLAVLTNLASASATIQGSEDLRGSIELADDLHSDLSNNVIFSGSKDKLRGGKGNQLRGGRNEFFLNGLSSDKIQGDLDKVSLNGLSFDSGPTGGIQLDPSGPYGGIQLDGDILDALEGDNDIILGEDILLGNIIV